MYGPSPMLKRKDKENIGKPQEFIKPEQIAKEMDELAKYYGTTLSNADLDKTRKILSKVSPLNIELVNMRDENV